MTFIIVGIDNENKMVDSWNQLGFVTAGQVVAAGLPHVTAQGSRYVESERGPLLPARPGN